METKDVLKKIREDNNLTQEEFAERVLVTRQAVSRWETGETQPNTETLKILSKEFNVSINTLLGSPRQLYCQCCGMPLTEDENISIGHGWLRIFRLNDGFLDFVTHFGDLHSFMPPLFRRTDHRFAF